MAVAAAAVVTACGGGSSTGAGVQCPGSAIRGGVALDIAAPFATKVAGGQMTVCWAEQCSTKDLHIANSSRSGGTTCTGTGPAAVCGAQAVPTEDKHGFADVRDLPTTQVTVTLRLTDAAGATVLDNTTLITPETRYPHGPECGGGTSQAGLEVSGNGVVRERS